MTRTDFIIENGKELNAHWGVHTWLKGAGMREVIYSITDERDNETRRADHTLAECIMRMWVAILDREISMFYENDWEVKEIEKRIENARHELDGMRTVYEAITGREWKEHHHDKLIDWLNACAYERRYWRELNSRLGKAE